MKETVVMSSDNVAIANEDNNTPQDDNNDGEFISAEEQKDRKLFYRQMRILIITGVVVMFVGVPMLMYYLEKAKEDVFKEGKTLWCSYGDTLIPVSLDKGYRYDENINAYISPDDKFAIKNSAERCSY
jgi:hypothetical protein